MADTTPLLASLLMGQRQDQYNPFAQQRKLGQNLIVQGSATTPLGSGNPLEGLARALTGGIGGLAAGLANRDEEAQIKHNTDIYSRAASERDPQKAAELLKGLEGGGYQQEALLGQIIQNNINEGLKQQQAGGVLQRGGGLGGDIPGSPGTGGTSITITPGQRAAIPQAWDQHIQAAAAQTGVPAPVIRSVASAESGGNPNAVSPAGAQGPMQLMPGTARDLGVQNPTDPATAIPAGAEYLKQMYAKYGNVDHALAAYNWGPGNVDNWLKAGGNPAQLPQETQAYITKVKAGMGDQAQAAPAQGPQVAQAGPPAQMQLPQVPVAPDAKLYWEQAQQFAGQGDNVKAVEYKQKALEAQAKFAANLQEKQAGIGMAGTEHDRQQATATPNSEQSLSGGFSDRMMNSERLIRQYGSALTSAGAKAKDMIPFGIGNYGQSPEYQQAKQARDDFINAQLRRESGAAIAPTEYTNADRQYFPQPGDGPDVIAQKERNRQLAIEGMVRNAGPAYQASPTVRGPQSGGSNLLDQAREAIKQGAPRDKVIERLRAQGISGEGL